MAQIRVGVIGWNGAGPAVTINEVGASRQVLWVEIDGQRLDGRTLKSVKGDWTGEGFHTTSVEFIGLPEFVYLDRNGEPLNSTPDSLKDSSGR